MLTTNLNITIIERLRVHSECLPQKEAFTFLRDDGKVDVITFLDLYNDARALATELLKHTESGSRALLVYPSGLEFIKAFLACLYAGIIAVPSSMPRKERSSKRLTAILRDATPSLILTTASCHQMVATLCLTGDHAKCHCLATDALEVDPIHQDILQTGSDLTAFLQYTSGSTGTPNGVEVTHNNIISNVKAIATALGLSQNSVNVGWLPLFHDMGLIANVLAPIYVGSKSVLMSPNVFLKNPLDWLRAISTYRGTCAGSPNFGWDYCVARISEDKKKELDLSSLEVAYNGSEPVRGSTLQRFYESFSCCGFRKEALFPCYGMAESTLFVSGGPIKNAPIVLHVSKTALEGNQIRSKNPESEDSRQIVSCGHVAEDLTVVVVDPETFLPCSALRIGEIWIAGGSVAKGYWRRPEETKRIFQAYLADSGKGPFLRSGDLGFIQDGELFITGRSKDLIVINGRNIYPQDIEQVIERSIDFVEPNMCAAFSLDRDNRETLAIVAEANRSLMRAAQLEQREAEGAAHGSTKKNEYLVKLELLASHICTVIAEQFDITVSSIAFVKPGTFPRTSSGKVQRLLCKQMALEGQLDIAYVMPDSIFDRRQAHDSAALFRTALTQSDAIAQKTPAPLMAKAIAAETDLLQSQQTADEMIAWFRTYAEHRMKFRRLDESRTLPAFVVLDLGNKGFFGLQVPRRLGGCELTTTDMLRVLEQIAGVDLALAVLINAHNTWGLYPILRFADAATQQRVLPDLAAGRRLASSALTEPGGKTEPMQATAMKTGGGWRINARKQWIGIGSSTGVLTVYAKAIDANGLALGEVALMMAEDTPGCLPGPDSMTIDMRGIVQNTVSIQDVFVPDSALLGSRESMSLSQEVLMSGRLGVGAMCVGAMKRCAQLTVRHGKNGEFGAGLPLDNARALATLEALTSSIFAVESLILEIANLADQGIAVPDQAYMVCKTAAPALLGEAGASLVHLLDGPGYIGLTQIIRDADILSMLEEPTEELIMHLGAAVLRQGESIVTLLSKTFNSAHVADQLVQAISEVKACAARRDARFGDEHADARSTNFQVGRLACSAVLLAAAKKRAALDEGPDSTHAIDWATRRLVELHQEIIASFSATRQQLASPTLLAIVARYERAIGDAGPGRAADMPGPCMGSEHGAGTALDCGRSAFPAAALVRGGQHLATGESQVLGANRSGDSFHPAGSAFEATHNLSEAECCAVPTSPTREIIRDSVINWLRSEKRRVVDTLDEEASFASLGMDSLGAIMLILELERRLGLVISPDIVQDYPTIGRLASYIDENSSSMARRIKIGNSLQN